MAAGVSAELVSASPVRQGDRTHTALWVYAAVTGLVGLALFCVQLAKTAVPCEVPECVWPRLSSAGLQSVADLGMPPWAWLVFAGTASLLWWLIPYGLGVVFARTPESSPAVAALWFTFSLGTFSGVLDEPISTAALRSLTLGAWFVLFAVYPTGRFEPRWVAAAPAVAVMWTVVLSLPAVRAAEAANDPTWWALESGVYVACVAVLIGGQAVRYRRGDAGERRRVRLLLIAFLPFLGLGLMTVAMNANLDVDALGYGSLGGALLYELSSLLTILLIGTVAAATARHGAFGIRLVVDRILTATVALAFAGATYIAMVLLASLFAPTGIAAGIAAVVTAVALAGTHGRIAHIIGRTVHGDADDPSAVAEALAQRVASSAAPEDLGPAIAGVLVERLRFPGVEVHAVDGSAVRGSAGRLDGRRAMLNLELDGRAVGDVWVTLRPGQSRLSSRDRRALSAASGPLATAATAWRLSDEVRRSRYAVVAARDEERRMLRRRLHDEIGPSLALAGHRIASARRDPEQLDAAADTIRDVVAQVRAISRELRPPALDEWGLRTTLLAFAEDLDLPVTVVAPERVRPAVVEVAAYRIVIEALLNASRHARANRVEVRARRTADTLIVDVDDDGVGMDAAAPPGVNTLSMRERATELGGSLMLERAPLGGLRVHAELPIDGAA